MNGAGGNGSFGWTLVIVGLVLAGIGLIWVLAPNLPRLGRLPGDIVIERENSRFYFPIVTCIVISAVLSLIMWLIREEYKAMSKKKPKQTWGWAPKKTASPQVPDALRVELTTKANELVESFLKPTFITPPPEDTRWNYLTDISIKWHGSHLYFVGTYACPGPNAISPSFESRFVRITYAGGSVFHLAYMRHTDKWEEVFQGLQLDECLQRIRDMGIFHPV